MKPRWQPCVDHRPYEVEDFVAAYFQHCSAPCLFIAGAGFDPRSTTVADLLLKSCANLEAILIKEERPNPDNVLVERARANLTRLEKSFAEMRLVEVDVFAPDGAVIGGRSLLRKFNNENLDKYEEVIVDVSALSIGISFPLVKYLLLWSEQKRTNLHLFAANSPRLDHVIRSMPSDRASVVHGFRRVNEHYGDTDRARLWLPQLTLDRGNVLQRIYDEVRPHDTCPILPFPSSDPQKGDKIVTDYLAELEETWSIDTRSLIYAHEDNPLDLYRKLLNIDDQRRPVFDDFGGSLLVLSPLGSRMLSIGALMAALDRNLPVYYVEARGYEIDWATSESVGTSDQQVCHVWLSGDVYPPKL